MNLQKIAKKISILLLCAVVVGDSGTAVSYAAEAGCSGSVCIGVYPDKDAAEAARARFAGGFCAVLQNTPRSLVWEIPPEI